ncbi:MAG: tRNA (adenosine(37)-N6)-threonylcarbamoyltransferase complex ATPase subunit type 1 TsaE [Candidatus Lumbricidophila eiseniae]|uniref:tRNA threonylcarbamoyladenosine biosynthesis protein TsaE n=1 Tax=Candidatus Lumbricidiphila eiseniae TaxID=1969409 RepID=A0A2A6FNJ8_9MICO|nr:MAG: tRNA (adenosine(37)-N6)-threonylcarbamoyltransferase complex ATPase subunit type 1 TsaE [Candidatus Lumbricidophila eiseniae]
MIRVDVPDSAAMVGLGRRLGAQLRAGDLIVLTGPLGAGKTTLTRGIGDGVGVRGPIQSPTFVLARSHPSLVGGPPLVHADAYRLGDAAELDDLDIDIASSVVVVEWGAGFVDGAAESWLEVTIERPRGARVFGGVEDPSGATEESGGDEPRVVTLRGFGPRWMRSGYETGDDGS